MSAGLSRMREWLPEGRRARIGVVAIAVVAILGGAFAWRTIGHRARPLLTQDKIIQAAETKRRLVLPDGSKAAILSGQHNRLEIGPSGGVTILIGMGSPEVVDNELMLQGGRNLLVFDPPIAPAAEGDGGGSFHIAIGTRVHGYRPGSDKMRLPGISQLQPVPSFKSLPMAAPSAELIKFARMTPVPVVIFSAVKNGRINGEALDFTRASFIVRLGPVSSDNVTDIVDAMNRAYEVAGKDGDPTGATPLSCAGEHLTFLVDVPAGVAIYDWASYRIVSFGDQRRAIPISAADRRHDRQIHPHDLLHIATLEGVRAEQISPQDFD